MLGVGAVGYGLWDETRALVADDDDRLVVGNRVANRDVGPRVALVPVLDGVGQRLFEREFRGEARWF
jgi:hypothetical protein